jgi:aspartyl aminopeptidase
MPSIKAMGDTVADLLAFIDRSPTPYHAVAECSGRLRAAGYEALREGEVWDLSPGDRCYVVRGGGSLVAFQVGRVSPAEGGFRVIGAHTDSPNLRVKPLPRVALHGYQQVAVEPYGGVLLHTWLDRDLSLAGRVTLRGESGPQGVLIDFRRPLLRIPNLAIHLQRELRSEGLKLDAQRHMVPVLGLEGAPPLPEFLALELSAQEGHSVAAEDILAFDLMTYDVQPSCRSGAQGEFIHAPRLDNLASCHAGISALVKAFEDAPSDATRMVVLYDHEEIGSRSTTGAAGPLLPETLERVVDAFDPSAPQGLPRSLSRSMLVSADMAHAVHPNHAELHEPGHRPRIGHGPVIKTNANQSYASDATTAGHFAALCDEVGITPQHFVTRSDLACGSTIGPISAAQTGIPTVDVGNPMLSMHSCREMAGSHDVEPMISVLTRFLGSPV